MAQVWAPLHVMDCGGGGLRMMMMLLLLLLLLQASLTNA
jgi:hypothetical protein